MLGAVAVFDAAAFAAEEVLAVQPTGSKPGNRSRYIARATSRRVRRFTRFVAWAWTRAAERDSARPPG